MGAGNKKIGIRNESSLHHTLKLCYTGPGGKTEIPTGEFVADGISKTGEFIEVQTGSFAPLKKKVKEFSKHGRVRIIHPIAVRKTIEVYEPGIIKPRRTRSYTEKNKRKKVSSNSLENNNNEYGILLYRRKSPKIGSIWNLFDVLIHAPELPLTRGLTIEVAMIDIIEKRVKDGKGARRRKGISIFDRELVAWHECILFEKRSDFLSFIPFKKNQEFTTTMLAESSGVDKDTARKALYVLTKLKVVKRIGKKGNSLVYVR